jgi:beta-lactam-binding protein with PASTA domain
VPDVTGQSLGAAQTALIAAGFNPVVSPSPIQSLQPKGTVASTSPSPGSQADTGSRVLIFLSDGTGASPSPSSSSSPSPSSRPGFPV